jgi:integrase
LIKKDKKMATVKFRLKSNAKKENTIYTYLSMGRGKMFEVKTGFSIEPQDWVVKTGFPKQNNPSNKNLHSDLKKLEYFIHDSINSSNAKGEIIDKFWLERNIKECFNRVEKKDVEILINHIQEIIDNAHIRIVKGKSGIGLSESRVKGYKTFLGIIIKYQTHIGKTLRLTEINNRFVDDFTNWMISEQKFSTNYAGKQIDNLKAVCSDAERLGISVNSFAKKIQSFKESDKDRFIVTLSEKEQLKIIETPMPTESLENVKKWIIIGCTVGQRGEDLLNFKIKDCRKKDDFMLIDVFQEKTQKWVTIPIMEQDIADIIMSEKPYQISLQKMNKYTKEVCKIAGIDTPTEGWLIQVDENKVKRKAFGTFPKWQLISTHDFRRSFATNYYKKIATPILMGITGHTRESNFLQYINKQADKDDNALLFALQYKQMKANQQ